MRPTLFVLAAALLAGAAHAEDLLEYAEDDGTVKTVQVLAVRKSDEKELSLTVRRGAKRTRLKIEARQVIRFRRGDGDSVNQWSKSLARGKRLMAAGQIATEGTVPGAEEMFVKVAYSVEKGTKGQEESERIEPWHNMYAMYYLIEARYRLGLNGNKEALAKALDNVEEFRKRTAGREGKKIKMKVPGEKGLVLESDVYAWGDTWLSPHVDLLEARVLRASGDADKARAAFEALAENAQKDKLAPQILTAAVVEAAEIEAEGKESAQAEEIFRRAGNKLTGMARMQGDEYGRQVVSRAGNLALLRGADLLLQSAAGGSLSYQVPLDRYKSLRDNEGKNDAALRIGAQTGIGICLTEKGEGKDAYETLLEVVVTGYEHPEQMARALFYLGKAAPLYAKAVEDKGGSGDFLRSEAKRWWTDLQERYPSSPWAKKTTGE